MGDGEMRIKNKWICDHRWLLLTAALSFLTALGVFLPAIIQDRGFFLIVDDFNVQQIPFTEAVRTSLAAKPAGEWFWGMDLGTSLINAFSFYNLGSPFFWITMLFPGVAFPYLVGWIFILKYVFAAVTAHLYLRRFLKEERFAVIGALLYAFSGFQSANLMFYHFHEVVAFFPLLLLALELVMEDRRYRLLFIFTVFLNCIVNYFFFIGEVVFLAVYFLVRFHDRPWKELVKAILNRVLDGAFGVCMAAVLFLPAVFYVMHSSRSAFCLKGDTVLYGLTDIMLITKGLLLPADLMNGANSIISSWRSTAAYLPLFGMAFVFAYLLRGGKWLGTLLLIFLTVSYFPFLQTAFYMFADLYQRWWYMLVLLLALATVKVLEEPKLYRIGLGVAINAALIAAMYIGICFVFPDSAGRVYNPRRFFVQVAVAILSPVVIWALMKLRRFNWKHAALLTALACLVTSGLTLFWYRELNTAGKYRSRYELGRQIEAIDEQYRFRTQDSLLTMNGEAAGYVGFCSTLENQSYAFNKLFDVNNGNRTKERADVCGMAALLGARYLITSEQIEKGEQQEHLTVHGVTYYFTEYSKVCPIGFSLDRYITFEQLAELPAEERTCALMHAFVVGPEQIETVEALAKPFDVSSVDLENDLLKAIGRCQKNAVSEFHRDNTGFRCKTAYDTDRYVYFTVPYDEGWIAEIDGVPAEILNSGGMILLAVPAGEHAVSFIYHTPGLRLGALVSGVSWLAFIAAAVCRHTLRKRKSRKTDDSVNNRKIASL